MFVLYLGFHRLNHFLKAWHFEASTCLTVSPLNQKEIFDFIEPIIHFKNKGYLIH